jgi:cell division protein FtsA
VLTGGGSLLPGMPEAAEQVFDLPVRLGQPSGAEGLSEPTSAPQYATAIGLALFGARNRRVRKRVSLAVPVGGIGRVGDKVRSWFSEIF